MGGAFAWSKDEEDVEGRLERPSFSWDNQMEFILGIVGLLIVAQIVFVVVASRRRRERRREEWTGLLESAAVFYEDSRLTISGGWAELTGRMHERPFQITSTANRGQRLATVLVGVATGLDWSLTARLVEQGDQEQELVLEVDPPDLVVQLDAAHPELVPKLEQTLQYLQIGVPEQSVELVGQGDLLSINRPMADLELDDLDMSLNLLNQLATVLARLGVASG